MRRLLVAALVALLVLPLVAADPVAPGCVYEEAEERPWGTVRPFAPRADDRAGKGFASEFVGFAVGQKQGSQAVVVDARGLQVTADAGCTWDETLYFDDTLDLLGDVDPSSAVFMDVAMSDRSEGDERVVALVYDLEYAGAARVRTMVSDDGGRTFVVGGQGLPTAHPWAAESGPCSHLDSCAIEVAPSDDDVVYVRLDSWLDTSLFRSFDGGLTFRRVNAVLGGLGETEGRDPASPLAFAIAHDDADTLWSSTYGSELLASTDGGRRWAAFDLAEFVDADVTEVLDVAMTPGVSGLPIVLAMVAVEVDGEREEWTVLTGDNGRTWSSFPTEWRGEFADVAGGSTPGLFVATTDRGAYQLDGVGGSWEWLDGSSLGPLHDVQPIDGTDHIWFRGPATLPVFGDLGFVAAPDVGLDLGLHVGDFDPLNPKGNLPGSFDWDNEVIRLEVDQDDLVDLRFDLPLNRTPLDVFFLFDQSGSMQEEMDALARNMNRIANELLRRRVDLHVGLGGYSGGWRYQLHKDIGPANDPKFKEAMESMRAGGGYETAYTALHQIATGTGLPDTAAGFGPPEGWNPTWRNGAVRIVIHLTDEELQVEAEPTIEQTLAALVHERIRVIGLVSANNVEVGVDGSPGTDTASLDSAIDEDSWPYGPVAQMARITDALAGDTGVDCSGDGEIDIVQGEPIACFLSPLTVVEQTEDLPMVGNLADVMIDVLDGVTELEDIEFAFDATGIIRSIEALDPTVDLDIREPQSIRIRATVACDELRSGAVHTPVIAALAGSRHLAAARLAVACGPVALTALDLPAVGAPPVPAAAAAAPAPPPPAPVQAPAPAQGIAQAANPATAQALTPQAGVAAAAQKQQQAQAASIGPAGPASDEGVEFAFTPRAPRDPAPAAVLAGAAMASAAGAVALRRQRSRAPGRARV